MVRLDFFVAILALPVIASVENGIPSSAASTVAPSSGSNNTGATWVTVSHILHVYDYAPESIKASLRGKVQEFNIFGNPPVYPPGMSAADFAGLEEEFGATELS